MTKEEKLKKKLELKRNKALVKELKATYKLSNKNAKISNVLMIVGAGVTAAGFVAMPVILLASRANNPMPAILQEYDYASYNEQYLKENNKELDKFIFIKDVVKPQNEEAFLEVEKYQDDMVLNILKDFGASLPIPLAGAVTMCVGMQMRKGWDCSEEDEDMQRVNLISR